MRMAYFAKKDSQGCIDFDNLVVDYTDGEIAADDRVKDISRLFPLKPKTNLIALCVRGKVQLRSGGNRFDVAEGDVLISPPDMCFDDMLFTDDFECRVMRLSDHIVQGVLRHKTDVWHHSVYADHFNIISGTSAVFQEEFNIYFSLIRSKLKNHGNAFPKDILMALLKAFLLELCYLLENTQVQEKGQKLSQGKVLFNKFISLIAASDVKRQPITSYASQLAITPKYLTMLCLKYSNKTASEWVVQYTIEEVRFYLRSSNLSIKEISAKLGFANMSHFGSYVRKHLGMSPSEFRHGKG